MKITILYYGAFRSFGKLADLEIDAPVTVGTVKVALKAHLGTEHQALIDDSVLANETDILPEDFVLNDACVLSILPPVCGG